MRRSLDVDTCPRGAKHGLKYWIEGLCSSRLGLPECTLSNYSLSQQRTDWLVGVNNATASCEAAISAPGGDDQGGRVVETSRPWNSPLSEI